MGFVCLSSNLEVKRAPSTNDRTDTCLSVLLTVMEVLENGVPQSAEFTPCSVCGRTFNPEVLVSLLFIIKSFLHRCSHASQARHERVCTQQVSKKRPVFNTSKKRIEGTEMQAFFASRPYLKTKKPSTAEMVGFWDLYDALTFHHAYLYTCIYSTCLYTIHTHVHVSYIMQTGL